MKMKDLFLLLLLISWPVIGFSQHPQQIKKDFTTAFSTGNTSTLKGYFKGFVNINIPGKKGFYSDTKAKWLLQDFFQKHEVKGFSLKENGYSGDNYYLIGQYGSGATLWNVYFLFSPGEKDFQIQQMDIEQIGK
jgi:hypothetical protein